MPKALGLSHREALYLIASTLDETDLGAAESLRRMGGDFDKVAAEVVRLRTALEQIQEAVNTHEEAHVRCIHVREIVRGALRSVDGSET